MLKINQLTSKRGVKRQREEYFFNETEGASDNEDDVNIILKKTEFRVKIKPKSVLKKKDVPSYIN